MVVINIESESSCGVSLFESYKESKGLQAGLFWMPFKYMVAIGYHGFYVVVVLLRGKVSGSG